MKYWYLGAAALGLAVAAGVILCRKKTSPEIDGGVRHFVDDHAPKKIRSVEITFFHCKLSTTDRMREDTPIAGHIITLHAEAEGCFFELLGHPETKGSFIPDAEFFQKLQALVSGHDLAQYNGRYYTVSGLPPDHGMELEIRYASGESVRSSDNQSCFMPPEAMEALVALFEAHK